VRVWNRILRSVGMIVSILVIPSVCSRPAQAGCVDYSSYMHWTDTIVTPGHPQKVAAKGDLACVACTDGGIALLDVSNPSVIEMTGVLPGMYASDVAVAGSFAYVADWGTGLRIVDIHDPDSLRIVGTEWIMNIASVSVTGSYAYVTEPVLRTFFVVDISDPTMPLAISGLDMPDFSWEAVKQGDFAYVACSYAGLVVVDVSDPMDPRIVGRADTPGVAYGVAVKGDYAYVADGDSGLTIVSIKDPIHPVVLANLDTTSSREVALSGSYLYMTDISDGLLAIDVSDPTAPTVAGKQRAYYRGDGVAVAGPLVLFADGSVVLAVDPGDRPEPAPAVAELIETPRLIFDVAARDRYAYVAAYYGGLQVIDLKDAAAPAILSTTSVPGYPHGVFLNKTGLQALIASGGMGLQICDVTDPSHPVRLGGVDTPGNAWDVTTSGSYAYVADGTTGIQVIRISDPSSPARVSSLNLPGSGGCEHVAMDGSYLLACDSEAGLFVVDVSNPITPMVVCTVPLPGGGIGVAVSGEYAYVAGNSFWVLDIRNPLSVVVMGSVTLPFKAYDVAFDRGCAYVTTEDWGLRVIDVADPAAPRVIGWAEVPEGYAEGIAVNGSNVLVAGQMKFMVFPTHCPTPVDAPEAATQSSMPAPILLPVFPNPSCGSVVIRFDLPHAGAPRLEILDVGGRRICTLGGEWCSGGLHRAEWDGRDTGGRVVPSGTYFVRLAWQDRSIVERLIIAR
jgi:hypothetical protein